jgi:hypothetical protein
MTVLSLRAGAEGLYALEAATGLIIAHGTWLERDDFARFIHHGTRMAAPDQVGSARLRTTPVLARNRDISD